MNTFELLKILSSESKAKIIFMYINCECHSHSVNDLCDKFNLNQANASKHLSSLHNDKILDNVKDGKEVFYRINPEFKAKYGKLINEIIGNIDENKKHTCSCKCTKKH